VRSGDQRDQPSGRQAWFANGRTDASGAVRPGAHLAALRARVAAANAARPAAAPGGGPQWNPLGPAGVGNGQADGRPRVSGRVMSIDVHPDGQRAYLGTANGGTWYTGDAGAHWLSLDTYAQTAPLTGFHNDADALSVGAIAVAWDHDPAKDVVYVGTGEPRESGDTYFGVGIRVGKGPAAADPLDPTKPAWTLEAAADLGSKAVYRLAVDPVNPGTVYAATSVGLWRRTVAADGTGAWAKVFDPPPPPAPVGWLRNALGAPAQLLVVSDVVIARAAGVTPQTVYAAAQDMSAAPTPQQVWRSASGDPGSWQPVPGYTAVNRISLGVAPSDQTVVYALARGAIPDSGTSVATNAARLTGGTFQPVTNAPVNLMGDVNTKTGGYCVVVRADPADPNVLWLAGLTVRSPATNDANAALFRAQLTPDGANTSWSFGFLPASAAQPGNDPSWVGAGAHPDVHALAFSGPAATSTVWLGCDGGVFQCQLASPAPVGAKGTAAASNTAPGPWQPLNNGLAITQPNYLAQTSVSDFLMLAGTQDNGTQERAGSAVWTVARESDGGGCAIDDAAPNRRFAQYLRFNWNTVTAPGGSYAQTLNYSAASSPLSAAWKTEDAQSASYSQAAARPLASRKTALAFGSHRVWYCEDWGQGWTAASSGPDSWRTLPTGSNPYEHKIMGISIPDNNQDSLHSAVIRVAFADDNRLLALTQAWLSNVTPQPSPRRAALYLFTRTGASWAQSALSSPAPGPPAGPVPAAGPQPRFPDGEVPRGLAIDQAGPPLTCYVTFGIDQRFQGMDHVWWYDGTSWWPCKPDPHGPDSGRTLPDAPANAVVVDADRSVYVGTDVGVWKGTPSAVGAAHWWAWDLVSDGLPEAPVTDLVLLNAPHLLRAATHGRGVWELNLDEVSSVNETYLRAHGADTRRVLDGAVVPAGKLFGAPDSRIDASPDILVSNVNFGAVPSVAPVGLPLARTIRPRRNELVRVLQYALLRRQAAAQPPELAALAPLALDGLFGPRTEAAVRTFQQHSVGLTATGKVTAADWQAIVTAPFVDALAGESPTYLDMALFDRIRPVPNLLPGGPSLLMVSASAEVYVQVNARGWTRRPVGTVRLGLLATPAFDATLAGLPALPGDWVAQFRKAATVKPATWLTDSTDWAWIGSPATLPNTRPLHPEEPQVIRFTVTMPLPAGAATLPAQWTLLAVVDDPLLAASDPLKDAPADVSDLVLHHPYAAARSVQVFS